MNWKRPQDELPKQEMEVLMRIEVEYVYPGEPQINLITHSCGRLRDKTFRAKGFFGNFSPAVMRWLFIPHNGETTAEETDGAIILKREFTHWCEIEEPK